MLKKKNKNKKIDIYTALMLPLMTMFLLNIGLIATTWAWYTASVSSGVNEIKAGATSSTANISIESANTYRLSAEPEETVNQLTNFVLFDGGSISLTGGNAYIFSITNEGTSHSGYYCLLAFKTDGGEVEKIYTENFGSQTTDGNEVTFIACLYDDATVSLQTFWGNPPEDIQTVEEVVELFKPQAEETQEEIITGDIDEMQQATSTTDITDEPTETTEDPVMGPTDPSSETEIVSDPSSEEINGGEPTTPVQEPEQSTAPSENEKKSTQTNGKAVVEEDNDEVGGTGEETSTEAKAEVVDNARSESGD